jgi:plasmid maintenance system antidote protein VapI
MSADFWLGLQQDWDLWHALRSSDAVEIERLTPLPRAG